MIVDFGKYYVYRHIRLDKNEPFYIGIGTMYKREVNPNRAYSDAGRNDIWRGITNKSAYEVEIILWSDNYEFIKEKEQEFIKLYGRIDLGTGILCNLTDGGEGVKGMKNPKTSERNKSSKGNNHWNYGRKRPDVKKRVGENHPLYGIRGKECHRFGQRHTIESKLKISQNNAKPMKGKLGILNSRSKLIIDEITGIFYYGVREAAEAKGIPGSTLSNYLYEKHKNKTSLRWA